MRSDHDETKTEFLSEFYPANTYTFSGRRARHLVVSLRKTVKRATRRACRGGPSQGVNGEKAARM